MQTHLMVQETWNGAAEQAATKITTAVPDVQVRFQKIKNEVLRQEFEKLSDEFFNKVHNDNQIVIERWKTLGAIALAWATENTSTISKEYLVSTLVRKQTDYGHNNIAKYGRQGLIIRVHDKIARFENLITKNVVAINEPIQDTLLDIAGYSAIGIMWENGTFMFPLE